MVNKITKEIKGIKYYEEKKRFLLFSLLLLVCLFLSFKLFGMAYASYQTTVKLNANIDQAIYLINNERMTFNIDSSKIIPAVDPYIYKFSISNFNATSNSDIDIEYELKVTTTTNLPLTFALYRNQNYDDIDAVNLFSNSRLVQDTDGAWYNIYEPSNKYLMKYTDQITDIYTLVITFPKVYSSNDAYADAIEDIEVVIKSKQVME